MTPLNLKDTNVGRAAYERRFQSSSRKLVTDFIRFTSLQYEAAKAVLDDINDTKAQDAINAIGEHDMFQRLLWMLQYHSNKDPKRELDDVSYDVSETTNVMMEIYNALMAPLVALNKNKTEATQEKE